MLIKDNMLIDFLTRCFRERVKTISYGREEPRDPAALSLLQALTKQLRAHPERPDAEQRLREVCNYFVNDNLKALTRMEQMAKSMETPCQKEDKASMYMQVFNDTVMGNVVLASFWLNDVEMLQQAVRCVKRKLPANDIYQIRDMMLRASLTVRATLMQM